MLAATRRTLRFTSFILLEYLRSARILVEIVSIPVFYFIFLRREEMNAEYFFAVTGVYTPLLTLYTMSVIIGLGDRPQSYMLLVRRLGRAGYLMGLFLATVAVVAATYGVICLMTGIINSPVDLDPRSWILGTLPLMLNVALLAALLLMLSPLVFPTGWRLFVLAMIALAFSGNILGGTFREQLATNFPALLNVIGGIQAVLSWPLVPAFSGFALALSRDYSGSAPVVLLSQISLLISLLGLSIYAFIRRDLIFSQ